MEKLIRKRVSTENAPAAVGPYAQANILGDMVYTSGQIPLNPKSGEILGTTIEEQTVQALDNLKAVVEASGSSMSKIIKTTVFLNDINNFQKMNEIYAEYFSGEHLPSRSAFEVAALPKGALVEIEAIAYL